MPVNSPTRKPFARARQDRNQEVIGSSSQDIHPTTNGNSPHKSGDPRVGIVADGDGIGKSFPGVSCSTHPTAEDIRILNSGLEEFKKGRDKFCGTKGAHNESDHVVACSSSTSNIVVTAYDNIKGENGLHQDTHIFTSVRRITEESADDETTKLKELVMNSMCRQLEPAVDSGPALCDLVSRISLEDSHAEVLKFLGGGILPAIKRTVNVHIYDIPTNAISPAEREILFSSRREDLHRMMSQLTQCTTLVLAFESFTVLENSHIDDFFRKNPKRTNMKVEMRIGLIWSCPVVTPKTRILRDRIPSIPFVHECHALLNRRYSMDKCSCEASELRRCQLLDRLNDALGAGWVVPYGSLLRGHLGNTRNWQKEVWIWGPV